jgi:hypothetical protein
MGDLQGPDAPDFRKGGGCVEESCKCLPNRQAACPIQVAEDGSSLGQSSDLRDDGKLSGGVLPVSAVEEESIDPAPEFTLNRGAKVGLPPEGEGKIGIKVRKDNALERVGGEPPQSE